MIIINKHFLISLFFIGIFQVMFFCPRYAFAESVTTSVRVGNAAPGVSIQPREVTASTVSTPSNVGTTVAFTTTATDSNGDNYYLAVCKSDAITPNTNGAPTCGGDDWCTSASTTSGSAATCNYTTLQGDADNSPWFAFICDHAASSSCSTAYQQTGEDFGSPFIVNHAPSFTAISNDTPRDVGGTITWSTSVGTSDPDTYSVADTVKLVVCKTTGVSAGDCDGGASDRWCESTGVSNNPSCSYGVPVPTADNTYNAYAYIFDSHNFAPTGGNQGSASNYVVNNMTPVVSAVSLNGGADITLSEGTTTTVVLGATITDNNSCGDISTVIGNLYRSSVLASNCDTDVTDDDDNDCYAVTSCIVAGGNTCDGAADSSASYQCTVRVKHFADPTDTLTVYAADTWKDTIVATDDDAAAGTAEVSTGVEMISTVAMDIGSTIAFGDLNAGQKNDPLDKVLTIIATGNVGLDSEFSGTDMDDGDSHTIPVDKQKYALGVGTSYAAATSLSVGATTVQLNCLKTKTTTNESKNTYWGIEIPLGTFAGDYSGSNTVTAVKGDTGGW